MPTVKGDSVRTSELIFSIVVSSSDPFARKLLEKIVKIYRIDFMRRRTMHSCLSNGLVIQSYSTSPHLD